MIHFKEIKYCEVCGLSDSLVPLCSVGYQDERILPILLDRYQGNLTIDDLGDCKYELIKCTRCSFFFQKFVPNEALLVKIYSYSQSRIEESKQKSMHLPIEKYLKNYSSLLKLGALTNTLFPSEKKVLDFGMGWGNFLMTARNLGYKVSGVEVSSERIQFAKENNIFCVNSLEELEQTKFDIIYSSDTFEHLPSPHIFLNKLSKNLHNDGIIFISVPNGINILRYGIGEDFTKKVTFPLEHVNCFTNRSLKLMAAKAGLVPIPKKEIILKFISYAVRLRKPELIFDAIMYCYRYNKSTELFFTLASNNVES